MNERYIAGFFDGEGSAMILTIRRELETGTIYRFRPVVKIAQKNTPILKEINQFLGMGAVLSRNGVSSLQINGNKGVVEFVRRIAPHVVIKKEQLLLINALVDFQDNRHTNCPYSKEDLLKMIVIRDKVFRLNCLNRTNLKQKYPKKIILKENKFVDRRKWIINRSKEGTKALIQYQLHNRKLRKLVNCLCGCGAVLENVDAQGRSRKYIWGHNAKNKTWRWKKLIAQK